MFKLSNFIVIGGVLTVVAWGANAKHQNDAAARANAVSIYKLTPQQAGVYDGCLSALEQKKLTKGGGKEPFCGCFASVAAADDSGLKYSVDILKQIADKTVAARNRQSPYSSSQGMDYLTAFVKTANAVRGCASDQQHIFASKEDVTKWCDAKPERTAGFICQHRPL